MKKIVVLTLALFAATNLYAQTDKSKYCPKSDQLRVYGIGSFFVEGVNQEGKRFKSKEITHGGYEDWYYVEQLSEELSEYDVINKKISCVYQGYFEDGNGRRFPEAVTIFNMGDY